MKTKRILLSIALICLTFTTTLFSQTIIGNQQLIQVPVTAWGTPTNALLSLPDDYTSGSQNYPLIVFLHGWGEAGTDINKLTGTALPQRIAQGFRPAAVNPVDGKLYKFIVVSPQAPDFSYQYTHIKNIMADILKKYRVDLSRIYITGLSAGGFGTWTCMSDDAEFAKTIAAVAPISSMAVDGNRPNTINNATKNGVAVWNICGMADDKWPVAVDYTSRLNAINPVIKAKLTGLPGVGHSAWNEAYDPTWKVDNMNLYEWLLQYTRNGKSVTTTTINTVVTPVAVAPVINAGTDQTITLPVNSTVLQGTGSAAAGLYIATVKWSKIGGPSQFTLTNDASANPALSNLVAGVYSIELAVSDNKGTIAKDTVQVSVKAPVVVNSNKGPVANAGTDKTITLPTSSITLSADGSGDADGYIAGGKWSKISGPSQSTMTNEHTWTPTFSNLVAGVYQVELYLYDDKGAEARDTIQVTVKSAGTAAASAVLPASSEVSGTNDINIQLYPNPASDVIRIKFTSAATGNMKARIFDVQGKLVQSSDLEKPGMVFEKAINISSLRPGQYLLRLEQANGKPVVEKFMKQ
jgi:predicted esterase